MIRLSDLPPDINVLNENVNPTDEGLCPCPDCEGADCECQIVRRRGREEVLRDGTVYVKASCWWCLTHECEVEE